VSRSTRAAAVSPVSAGLGPHERDTLDREGWIAIPGVLTPQAAGALARRCDEVLDDEGDARQGDKRAGGTRHASSLLDRVPEIAGLFEHRSVRAAAAHLLGRQIPVSDVAFRCPQPGFGTQSLHADDMPITRAGECRAVTSIVALCDFGTTNGATAVVPGSHVRPDLQQRAARLGPANELLLTGPAGTAFVFSSHLVHRGTQNRSGSPRPALQAQWRLRWDFDPTDYSPGPST